MSAPSSSINAPLKLGLNPSFSLSLCTRGHAARTTVSHEQRRAGKQQPSPGIIKTAKAQKTRCMPRQAERSIENRVRAVTLPP
jgi:hypothetical protein